jgi:hypothetical protein
MTEAGAALEVVVWQPERLAHEALSECAEMLKVAHGAADDHDKQTAMRKALRAAHDAMHCSLVVILHRVLGGDGHPYKDRLKAKAFIEDKRNVLREISKEESDKYFMVASTLNLINDAMNDLKAPINKAGASELIAIRNSIEHPKPGVTGWSVSNCVEAIAAGGRRSRLGFARASLRLRQRSPRLSTVRDQPVS